MKRNHTRSRIFLLTCLMALSGLCLVVRAQVPDSIAVQAVLTEDDGTPVDDGDVTLTFKLHDAAVGGSELWSETQDGIRVADGVFSVYLGRLKSLEDVGFEKRVWLSIARGDEGAPELEPRIPLVATPYAIRTRWLGDEALVAGENVSIDREGNALVVSGTAGWALDGNAGTDPGVNFIGTTDSAAFEVRVENLRGLRVERCTSVYCDPGEGINIIAGGGTNSIDTESGWGTISGGEDNRIIDNGHSVIGGGQNNESLAGWGTIGGGSGNRLLDLTNYATIAGGVNNVVGGHASFVGGGGGNVANGFTSSVLGGTDNMALGSFSMVVGGRFSVGRAPYTFAAGFNARANHEGSFVWNDRSRVFGGANLRGDSLFSTDENQFIAKAAGGVFFYTNSRGDIGARLDPNSGAWSSVSDRNLKEGFEPVDGGEILERLSAMPVTSWRYDGEDPEIRHMGPVAQDFREAFGLGKDDRHITTVDADGVAFAAIQELYRLVRAQQEEIERLQSLLGSRNNVGMY